ncbi:hypothetical protein [Variovorax sp. UC122_21]|uniref:hypothetical protein n=1 Tax=Variovorax sp. UC122_21 TaxID=3374554 RepID=UPI00375738E3
MVKKKAAAHILSEDERTTLLAIIDEQFGPGLIREEFDEAMLDLFENIPGFETISPAKASHTVNQLWSTYHGKEARREQ